MLFILHDCVLQRLPSLHALSFGLPTYGIDVMCQSWEQYVISSFQVQREGYPLQNPTYLQFCDVKYDQLFLSRHL